MRMFSLLLGRAVTLSLNFTDFLRQG
jgi:hypothetical protein